MTKTLILSIAISQVTFFFKTPHAQAGILSLVTNLMADEGTSSVVSSTSNSQKMPLLEAPLNSNGTAAIEEASSSVPDTTLDDEPTQVLSAPTNSVQSNKIITYKVQAGDTISSIAEKFNISVNTILWSNDLTKNSTLKSGQSLVILPMSGIGYEVQKGDTLSTIAQKYNGNMDEIMAFNNLGKGDPIKPGQTLLIPNGEQKATTSSKPASTVTTSVAAKVTSVAKKVATVALGVNSAKADTDAPSSSSIANSTKYYIRPISGGIRTQGIHGNNAVDLADACGTPIYASASGEVIVSKSNGAWNGGYGNYVVISHGNGSQTLYGHMQKVSVSQGDQVSQGDAIGTIGNTGEVQGATGCHVHFEIRNGISNPF